MDKIFSFGVGVNSTAMILMLYERGERWPIVFADTGNEWPETYEHLERFREFIKKKWNAEIETLRPPYDWAKFNTLESFLLHHKIIPTIKMRMCTDKFKVRPMLEKYNTAIHLIGYDYGERHRIEKFRRKEGEFPLIDAKIDRRGCKKIIKQFGIKIPIKSGCFFCPNKRKVQWIRLQRIYPDLFERTVQLENNAEGKNGKKWTFRTDGLRLDEWLKSSIEQQDLFECMYCFK